MDKAKIRWRAPPPEDGGPPLPVRDEDGRFSDVQGLFHAWQKHNESRDSAVLHLLNTLASDKAGPTHTTPGSLKSITKEDGLVTFIKRACDHLQVQIANFCESPRTSTRRSSP